jgi:hypothetical protein
MENWLEVKVNEISGVAQVLKLKHTKKVIPLPKWKQIILNWIKVKAVEKFYFDIEMSIFCEELMVYDVILIDMVEFLVLQKSNVGHCSMKSLDKIPFQLENSDTKNYLLLYSLTPE